MIRMVCAIAISMTLLACNGQKRETENKSEDAMPQTNIKVNKEYDKNGNIIRFDSTYSYYYSNTKGDTSVRDSILGNFKNQFNQKYFFSNDPYFKNFFFQDSLLMYDFYKKDFFYNRFKNNMAHMDSLFHQMDSVKNEFYSKQLKEPKQQKRK